MSAHSDQYIQRYNAQERLNHWLTAITFILLAASGLAFFHPAFWFLTSVLGGGTWSRILHPFLGVVMFVAFALMAVRYWKDNIIQPYDKEWQKRLSDVINNRDNNLPEIDKYNIGQKQLFWTMIITMVLLMVSGVALINTEHVLLDERAALETPATLAPLALQQHRDIAREPQRRAGLRRDLSAARGVLQTEVELAPLAPRARSLPVAAGVLR